MKIRKSTFNGKRQLKLIAGSIAFLVLVSSYIHFQKLSPSPDGINVSALKPFSPESSDESSQLNRVDSPVTSPTTVTTPRDAKMHFITVQTGASPPWCRMLLSAFLSENITVTNLAWGMKYSHTKRPEWILEFLTTANDSDVVLFADGGDTIFTGFSSGHVLNQFASRTARLEEYLNTTAVAEGSMLHPVLFNAEANCYHQQTFDGSWGVKKGKCLSAYKRYDPNVTSPYRYLNGGAWIARVWAAKKVFSTAVQIIKKDRRLWCDQSVLGGILLAGTHKYLLGLDRTNAFFLPTYHLRVQRDFCDDVDDFDKSPRMKLCHSGNTPSVVHFNGKSEGRFTSDVIHRTLWYKRNLARQTEAMNEAESYVTFLGVKRSPIKFRDVCKSRIFPS